MNEQYNRRNKLYHFKTVKKDEGKGMKYIILRIFLFFRKEGQKMGKYRKRYSVPLYIYNRYKKILHNCKYTVPYNYRKHISL